ncbi:MAG: hypothetical protein SCH39_02900 [Methanosarcinales archaeon]|nr:hypothetical protein [Methanosarcinales archaeon]
MSESLENIISKGFHVWSRNLNICIPLIVNYLLQVVVMFIAAVVGILILFGTSSLDSIATMDDNELLQLMSASIGGNITTFVVLVILVFVVLQLFQSYFFSGAVGMSQSAIAGGDTSIADMFNAAGSNFMNVFMANVIIVLVELAGIVFVVPGAILVRNNWELIDSSQFTGGILLLFIGISIWLLYLLILGLLFSVIIYVIVIEHVGALDGITEGVRFFLDNKVSVFIMWFIVFIVSAGVVFVFYITGNLIALTGSDSLNIAWSFGSQFILLVTLHPLIIVLWTRLYMVKTGKDIYIDELLTEPWGK